jgi:actin-like ATPase involved in cell morphogenesis
VKLSVWVTNRLAGGIVLTGGGSLVQYLKELLSKNRLRMFVLVIQTNNIWEEVSQSDSVKIQCMHTGVLVLAGFRTIGMTEIIKRKL